MRHYPTTEVKNGEPVVILNKRRRTVEKLLANPEKYLQMLQGYGLFTKDDDGYKSV